MFGTTIVRPALYRFAYLGNETHVYSDLASKAEPEMWDRPSVPTPRHFWLKRYMCIQFELAEAQEKIAPINEGGQRCCFDTGLRTPTSENLYALFARNRVPNVQPWYLIGFHTAGERELSDFARLPVAPRTYADVAEIAFDRECEWRVAYSHLIDRRHRARYPQQIRALSDLALVAFLRGAIEQSRVAALLNVDLPTPQLYGSKLGFFARLRLGGHPTDDLAVVLEHHEGHFRVPTVLPMDWAYPLARIVGRPTGWLDLTRLLRNAAA